VLELAGQIAIHQIAAKGFNKMSKGASSAAKTGKTKQTGEPSTTAKTLRQVLPSRDAFLKSAETTW